MLILNVPNIYRSVTSGYKYAILHVLKFKVWTNISPRCRESKWMAFKLLRAKMLG